MHKRQNKGESSVSCTNRKLSLHSLSGIARRHWRPRARIFPLRIVQLKHWLMSPSHLTLHTVCLIICKAKRRFISQRKLQPQSTHSQQIVLFNCHQVKRERKRARANVRSLKCERISEYSQTHSIQAREYPKYCMQFSEVKCIACLLITLHNDQRPTQQQSYESRLLNK